MTQREVFQDIYLRLRKNGKFVAPRGLPVLEVENFTYELPPFYRFANFGPRKLSIDYVKREFIWYLKGDLYDLSIGEHARIWRNIVINGKLNSNYGYYAFVKGGMAWVIEELMRDKDSRRACFTILDRSHLNSSEMDVPCTAYLNFRIRENKLNMSVHMRSQDALYGLGNDAPAFSFFQEMLLVCLRNHYSELQMGSYHHTADSFHVYAKLGPLRGFEMLEQICDPDVEFTEVEVPRISDISETYYLVEHLKNGTRPAPFNPFSQWLTSVVEFPPLPYDISEMINAPSLP